jgi:gamma-glutamyl-gamma-aminobutyrate hydrolase PuuD
LKIGLTQRVLLHQGRAYDSIEHAWYKFLDGHKLIFIPNTLEQDFAELIDQLDCVIITGGDDSTPRRATELKIASSMMMAFKPILGICHGAFLLTDVLGGEVNAVEGHSNVDHTVHYAGREIQVNSHHNLAIQQLHSTGQVLAQDAEGNCEAWIDGNMAGIVWHPERMTAPFIPAEIQQVMKL